MPIAYIHLVPRHQRCFIPDTYSAFVSIKSRLVIFSMLILLENTLTAAPQCIIRKNLNLLALLHSSRVFYVALQK